MRPPCLPQVYKWVPANLMLGGNPAMDQHPIQGGVEILSVASCYGNRDKLRPDGPLGPNADFTFTSLDIGNKKATILDITTVEIRDKNFRSFL